ncbi:hypothetical protein Plim_1006 [Planctopirus limnophila DSM 3776]|uniref:Pyrrolo-quinoline quinone n=1 Tax=Planctopirus limnophila (strain ATCC 43296 / DSM 3776 / IFAM 1008 / Mu 290) TaxID=521674 RepID=D5ST81_PLAL2|nr:hypothetical protein [Planctopirus limnophila]ADG66849.1 hypothetical protein Plim_1006 [Planctopirus limnophila DSM 3776]
MRSACNTILYILLISVAATCISNKAVCSDKELPQFPKAIGENDWDTFPDAASKVLLSSSVDELNDLEASDDISAQLFARWEKLCRRHGNSRDLIGSVVGGSTFSGFVQGRLHCVLPDWWGRSFSDRLNLETEAGAAKLARIGWQRTGRFFHPLDTTVEKVGHQLFVQMKGMTVPLDLSEVNPAAGIFTLAVAKEGPKCFVAVAGTWAFPYSIFCFDIDSKKLVWRQEVWCSSLAGASGISGIHLAGISVSDGVVASYGATCDATYIEGFEIATGSPRFRFSTAYFDRTDP